MKEILENLIRNCRPYTRMGNVASYIPELAKAPGEVLAAACTDLEGKITQAGDVSFPFTMQSVSKLLSLGLALQTVGFDKVLSVVDFNPTADPFDSIMRLEMGQLHKPLNPMINAGAIAIVSILPFDSAEERAEAVLALARELCANEDLEIDRDVYLSEKNTGDRNRALAYFMKSTHCLSGDIENHLDAYFRQCSISVHTRDLSVMAATLAGNGRNPVTGHKILDKKVCQALRAVMITCGMYDGSGDFALKVGLPAKSGVSGAILAVIPDRLGLAVCGPSLDQRGNSVAGIEILRQLSIQHEMRII